jgi:hypothetical protein
METMRAVPSVKVDKFQTALRTEVERHGNGVTTMLTIRSIAVGLSAALAVIVFPLVATETAGASPNAPVSANVGPMGMSDYPWGP